MATHVQQPPTGLALLRLGLLSLRRRGRPGRLDPTAFRREARLDPARIDAYARNCGFAGAQGIPLTYPHNLAFPLHLLALTRPGFPFPVVGLVHIGNEIRQHARLHSADELAVEVALGHWVAHPRGQAITVETNIARDGAPIWASTSTYLRLGVPDPAGVTHDDLASGPARLVTAARWTLEADLGRRFARVSGDINPIHTSRLAARLFGLRRPIAHGMWSKARALAHLLPPVPVDRAHVRVTFRAPVFLPGAVTLLVAPNGSGTSFELRDRTETRSHLRGELAC